jgi:hypothetical protein
VGKTARKRKKAAVLLEVDLHPNSTAAQVAGQSLHDIQLSGGSLFLNKSLLSGIKKARQSVCFDRQIGIMHFLFSGPRL